MYTISKAPSKLVATKTRRGNKFTSVIVKVINFYKKKNKFVGLPQNFEKIETIREMSRKSANEDDCEFR